MTIKKLTKKQKAATIKYRDESIQNCISTQPADEFNTELVAELINKHRNANGMSGTIDNIIVMDSPMAAIKKYKSKGVSKNNAFYGQHDTSWLWMYKFWRDEVGLVEQVKPLDNLIELCKHVNWFWISSDTMILCRKPVKCHTNTRTYRFTNVEGKDDTFQGPGIHNPDGMAIEYADGAGIYMINNIDFNSEKWVVKTPVGDLDPTKILNIKNTELRSQAMIKYGIENFYDSLEKELVHEETLPIGGNYKLYDVQVMPNMDPWRFLRMVCPSKGEVHFEKVPSECNTVQEALYWRETATVIKGVTYQEPRIRT